MTKKFNNSEDNDRVPMTNNHSDVGEPSESGDSFEALSPNDFYVGSKNKSLLVHFMVSPTKEVGKPKKVKLSMQEVTYKKRIWVINRGEIITDFKGNAHYYIDINKESSYSFHKQVTDTCRKCGGKLAIDSKNVRDLVKRKTIETFWGVDSTHIMLLLIMGIVLVAMIGIIFYLYSDNSKLNGKLQTYLPPAPNTKVTSSLPATKMILPMVIQ